MSRQVETKHCSFKSIIYRASFIRGFNEVKHGIPMDYDVYTRNGDDINDRWIYERGRLFGHYFNGSLKHGKRVTYEAQLAMSDMMYEGAMI